MQQPDRQQCPCSSSCERHIGGEDCSWITVPGSSAPAQTGTSNQSAQGRKCKDMQGGPRYRRPPQQQQASQQPAQPKASRLQPAQHSPQVSSGLPPSSTVRAPKVPVSHSALLAHRLHSSSCSSLHSTSQHQGSRQPRPPSPDGQLLGNLLAINIFNADTSRLCHGVVVWLP